MPRAGLSGDAVVALAIALVDELGPEALTLANVAARAGVATPSLYKHVDGLAALRSRVAAQAMEELADRIDAALAGIDPTDRRRAVRALADAYRAYAIEHPARYALMPPQPLGDERLLAASQRLLDAVAGALGRPDLDDPDAIHAARALRSALHGFAVLESAGGFGMPADLDESFGRMIDALARGWLDA